MISIHRLALGALLLTLGGGAVPGGVVAAEASHEPLPRVAERITGLERRAGLLTFHVDRQRGTVLLEVPPAADPAAGSRYLYVEGLVTGLGSNPVGLDRGQIGPARLVALRRVGGRLLVEEINTRFRAQTDRPQELQAVRESFAGSVLWGGELLAEDPDGRVLVDFTSFLTRDAHGSARTLDATGQGSFALDADRSAVEIDACLAFPENAEFQAVLTFAGEHPGDHVRATVPSPSSVTLVQHQSFLRLPDAGYRPRRFDPRAGFFAVSFQDYSAPLDAPVDTRWIVRHRLQKVNPGSDPSRVVKPIVYYVDRAAPEPVRSALLDGARWWTAAFEAAGFEDAFRVELLPEGVHPLDARYNVIQWVHRSTRGWSYGGGVIDPRTGEMVKGHVSLGSLRVRQDRLLFQGLVGAELLGTGEPGDPVQVALARIRQLAAHEVGHTLGLDHNFAASTYGRASVMDYPAPLVRVTAGGDLDLSDAYGVGVGAWDLQAIRCGYSEFPPGADEPEALRAIVEQGLARGLVFLSDEVARPAGAAQPLASLWDNGSDPVEALVGTLEVRRIALGRFGAGAVPEGTPLGLLEEVLVPLYLHHRYQLEAAVKVIGGLDYTYAVRGDGQPPARMLDPTRQRRALEVILGTLDPAVLDIPEPVLELLLPAPSGYPSGRERFRGRADPAFDPLAAAETAAALTVAGLLQPERAARLVDFHRRDPRQPGLQEILDALVEQAFPGIAEPPRHAALSRVVQNVVVDGLISLAAGTGVSPEVQAHADGMLGRLRLDLMESLALPDDAGWQHRARLLDRIDRHSERPGPTLDAPAPAPEPPPGSPIGAADSGS